MTNWKSTKYQEIFIPKILYEIFSHLFDVPKSLDKQRSPKIKGLSKNCLISALISTVMDEGHICKTHYEIRITQKNKNILKLFHRICNLLNYEVSNIKKYGKFYSFKIKFFGIIKFYKDLNKIIRKFGEILDLGDKQPELDTLIARIETKLNEINNRKARGYHINIVEKDIEVLRYLKSVPLTRNEIQKNLKISFEEAHKRIGTLKQRKLVEVIGFKNKAHVCKVTDKGIELIQNSKFEFKTI